MQPNANTWTEDELRTNVGQLFIVGFHGHTPSDEIRDLIETHKVGSIIFFQRNIKDRAQLSALTSELQRIAIESGHLQPLFIGIDQENGLVTRIKEPVAAQLPGPMALAAIADASNAYRIGCATAETLKAVGINFNFAPVADVNSEPKNPVIGVRSPSDDPELVAKIVSSQIRGLRDGGVIPCVKHFPGHGDTDLDSHFRLPVILKNKSVLDECELVPFRRAIAEGVDAVMTAHIALPNLRPETSSEELKQLPASLNSNVIGILREELKYDGLVVSDCLEMDGVRATYGTEQSTIMALKAGTDCVMICHTISAQISAIELVVQAVKFGELSQVQVAESVKRIRDLKSRYLKSIVEPTLPENLEEVFVSQQSMAAKIYAKSTTLVRHDPSAFPLSSSLGKVVLITFAADEGGNGAANSGEADTEDRVSGVPYTSIIESISTGFKVTEINHNSDTPLDPKLEKIIQSAPAVILASRNANASPSQKSFGISLGKKLGGKLIVVATCEPYDFLNATAEVKNYIATYEPTIPAFKAAVDIIFGIAPALGRLPIFLRKENHDEQIKIISSTNTTAIYSLFELWSAVFASNWSIALPQLTHLLQQPGCSILLHPSGFSISYLLEDGTGKLTVIAVLPEFRNQGLGTALIKRARRELYKRGDFKSWSLGSSFPRFWPGVPFQIDREFGEWFVQRGFRKSAAPTARDLFRSIKDEIASASTLEKVSNLNLIFKPWTKDMEEETLRKQEENFGHNKAWVNAYHQLARTSQHHEVLVAIDPATSEQVGWTLMTSPTCPIATSFAFLTLAPSGPNTGLIACVGIDKSMRGRGVGLGLMVKAMENLKSRGVEGILIDWVVIRGFYETVGFKPLWEYEGYEWASAS